MIIANMSDIEYIQNAARVAKTFNRMGVKLSKMGDQSSSQDAFKTARRYINRAKLLNSMLNGEEL